MVLAARRGRKPINCVAMTAEERQAQYRFRRKAAANYTTLLDRIRLELSDENVRTAKRYPPVVCQGRIVAGVGAYDRRLTRRRWATLAAVPLCNEAKTTPSLPLYARINVA